MTDNMPPSYQPTVKGRHRKQPQPKAEPQEPKDYKEHYYKTQIVMGILVSVSVIWGLIEFVNAGYMG